MPLSNILFIIIYCYFLCLIVICDSKFVTYIDTERPMITYSNDKFIKDLTISSKRLSRKDPRHYVDYYIETLVPFGNNVNMNVYFYQFLTNKYRPSFFESHLGMCDYADKDPVFGPVLKEYVKKHNLTCPYPAGLYNITHIKITSVPNDIFPFTRGRVYLNTTIYIEGVTQPLGSGYIDIEFKKVQVAET